MTEEITEKAKKNSETAPRFVTDAIHSALKKRRADLRAAATGCFVANKLPPEPLIHCIVV